MHNSKIVIFPDQTLCLNLDFLFYFGNCFGFPEAQFFCMVDGIRMRGAKSEKGLFISIDDAIELCLREGQKKGAYGNFRKELAVEFSRWRDDYRRGQTDFRISDHIVIALEVYLASCSSKWGPKALAIVQTNRPDLFGSQTKVLGKIEKVDIVYFIRGETSRNIKIGYGACAKSRLKGFQTGSSEELVLLKTVVGGKKLETELHKRFHHLRIRPRHEWFRPEQDLLDYINSLE